MSEHEQDATSADDDAAEQPDRDDPISANARFTIGGKPVVLDDFIDITTGDVANRPLVKPQPQPAPMPKQVIWNARRPLDG